MSNVIRDVIIKIAIEQQASALRAPDISEYKKAIDQAVQYGMRLDRTAKIGGSIGGIGGGGSLAQKTDPLFGGRFGRMWSLLSEDDGPIKKATDATKDLTDAKTKDIQKTQEMAGAVLQLARGLSLLGASQSSAAREWLQYAAAAQGAMDTIQSIGQLAGKLPGGVALSGALGKVGPLASRVGLVGGAGIALGLGASHAFGAASDMYHGRQLGEQSNLFGLDINGDAAAGANQLRGNAAYYRAALGEQNDLNRRGDRLRAEFDMQRGMAELGRGMGKYGTQGVLDRHLALSAQMQQRFATQEKEGFFDDPEAGQLNVRKQALEAQQSDLRKELELRQQINRELDQEKQKTLDIAEAERKKVDAARDRMASLGRLDPATQGRLAELGKHLAGGGQLDEGRARLAEQFGVATDATRKFRLDQFGKSGLDAPDVRKGLGLGDGVDQLAKNLEVAEHDQLEKLEDIRRKSEANNKKMEEAYTKLGTAGQQFFEVLDKLIKRIDELTKQMQNAGAEGQKGNVRNFDNVWK